jgi:hypothetical protein
LMPWEQVVNRHFVRSYEVPSTAPRFNGCRRTDAPVIDKSDERVKCSKENCIEKIRLCQLPSVMFSWTSVWRCRRVWPHSGMARSSGLIFGCEGCYCQQFKSCDLVPSDHDAIAVAHVRSL